MGRPRVPVDSAWERQHRRQLAEAVNRILAGQIDTTTSITLRPSLTTTTLADARISVSTNAILTPTTANAAGALATTYWTCGNGLLAITHASAVSTDRTFTVSLLG